VEELTYYQDHISALHEELGLVSPHEKKLDVSDVTIERLQSLQQEFSKLSNEKEERAAVVESLQSQICELWEILGTTLDKTDTMDLAIFQHSSEAPKLSLSVDTIDMLEQKKSSLIQVRNQREEQVRQYGIHIINLWDQLQIPQDKRSEFFAKAKNLSIEVISAVSY
jgi:protein regulator of cytokinesis 1